MAIKVIVIEDNETYRNGAMMWPIIDHFGAENVEFFANPDEGLAFIKSHLEYNMIVFLDINFPKEYKKSGHDVLEEINNTTQLIPVIIWSGVDENKEPFQDLINNNAFGFIPKDTTIEEAWDIVERAELFFKSSVDNAIEDWLIANPSDKDKPIYFTSDSKSMSMNQIMREIRLQTEEGKNFVAKFNALTIDLLLRNREKLK